MRKICLSMMLSLDGYTEAPGHDINWHVWDDEMENYMISFFNTVDTIILGRKSYELMLGYWPFETGRIARAMNETPKLVFSKTLKEAEWNSTLLEDIIREDIDKLKQQPGKDMVLFGGATLASAFINRNLIDEYQIIVNPIALGDGSPLFKNLENKLNLKLTGTRVFDCGNVILSYKPA